MLAISIGSLIAATIAVYFSCTIKDEVFKVGTGFAGVLFVIITLVCAPWLLKLAVVLLAIPFILDSSKFGQWNTIISRAEISYKFSSILQAENSRKK